jgi:F-type H+-transporting ATPase subunit epsilon
MGISVKICALQKEDLVATTERLSIPTTTGRIEILPNHVPLITALDVGVLEWGKAGIACNRIVSHKGLAIILKDEVRIFLQGWQQAESRDEISSELDNITQNISVIKEEITSMKAAGGKLVERVKKEHTLGVEKARIDVARRVGLAI